MYKLILFDFDGVLANTIDMCYKLEKEKNSDLEHEQFKEKFFGNYWANAQEIDKDSKLIKQFEEKYKEQINKIPMEEKIKILLRDLSEWTRIAIVSSASETNIGSYLNNQQTLNYVDDIYGRQTHLSKVEKFKMLLEKYNLTNKDCIFITDTLSDIQEANEVNIQTIAVTWGLHDRSILEKGDPFKIVDYFEDLYSLLTKQNTNSQKS